MAMEIVLNGNVYFGDVKGRIPHGRGKYTWSDGTVYEGSWEEGKMTGVGRITWSSGASYEGDFSGGYLEKISFQGFFKDSGRISSKRVSLEEDCSIEDSNRELSAFDDTDLLSQTSDEGENETDNNSTVVYDREYIEGVLIKERTKNEGPSYKREQQHKFHTNEVKKKSSADIYEGHKSYYLMLNLQLGIRYTVGKITPVPMREVRHKDFGERARISMYFPKKGSQLTPSHYSIDFYWKDHCPMVFRNLREMFKLDAADYMMSICGDDGLRELSSPGKSGSIFYLSHDDRFVIKTLRTTELKVLLKMLPSYYDHVREHDNTLITKFYGLHEITLRGGKKVQFVVMGNMFYTELRIHRRYDLKGSSQGRSTNKDDIQEGTTLKDLDLAYDFRMDKSLRDALLKQIYLDCAYLESQKIIDYSLLLGLHFRAPDHLKTLLEPPDALHRRQETPADDGITSHVDRSIPPKGLLLVTHEPTSVNTAPGPHSRGSTMRAFSVGDNEVDLLLPGTARLRVQLGVNMPAQANRKVSQDISGSTEAELFEVYDVVLYLGVIDILQEYNTRKKIEHAIKCRRHDPMAISVADPKFYSKRFFNFMEKLFPTDS